MRVYRLSKSVHARDLTGRGAELSGGRWNSKGTPMIYTSDSIALSTAEIAVRTTLGNIPEDFVLIVYEISEDSVLRLEVNDLPPDWKSYPHVPSTQHLGDNFIAKNKFLILKAPSAVVPAESNFLINPKHMEMKKVKLVRIEPYSFDDRLYRKSI